jgi:tetratricopeptide (TPR) repeat protein
VVFVSHSTKDDFIVNGIRQTLELLGVEVWTDSQRLTAGDPLTPTVLEAIERCGHFLAILSTNAINSPWVAKEIKHALVHQKKVIPILLPPIEPSALPLWFAEEPVGLKLSIGPGGLASALPELLAGLGLGQPTEKVAALQAHLAPIADLILKLTDPSIDTSNGKRRAVATATLIYAPPDGGPEVESKRYRFAAPLEIIDADNLSWYLERYTNWPSGIFQERARRIEAALPQWGRLLYDSVNTGVSHDVLETWKAAPSDAERRFTIKVDKELLAGASNSQQMEAGEAATLLLSLPWELIHDETGYLFQGARGVRVRRSLPNRNPQPAVATKPPIRVLLVSPRPEDESAGYIDHRASARPLVEALSGLGELAEFTLLDPPTFAALEKELERTKANPYHVVHFDGHGVYDRNLGMGALCFEDPADKQKLERRRSQLITADKIAAVIRGHRVPLFFLEACQTAQAADDPTASVAGRLLENGVASVAAMSHSVLVETARRFVTAFYTEVLSGRRVGQAMLFAQRELHGDTSRGKVFDVELHLEDWFVPVLFQEEQDPQLIRELPAEEVRSLTERRGDLALGELPEEPPYRFQGRSRELLQAERLLARERYVVIQGEGGEGKTTLAAELARWLVLTRRFARAAFVRLDLDGEARKVLFSIGAQLVANYHARAAQDDKIAWQMVARALAEQETVVVLDNLESVLEPPPGSEAHDTFDADTLSKILDLCRDLTRTGRTRLIFTSREPLPEPFAKNRLKIGRLDRADAIRLVARVLDRDSGDVEGEQEIEALVDAVGCHARALVLLSGEVAASGVRGATENLHQLMTGLERKHPGERERSLLASVQLSLRRLPLATRQKIAPLGVFQGGGSMGAISVVLDLDPENDDLASLAGDLVDVGLAEQLPFGYLRFDPALAPALLSQMTAEERTSARGAWTEAMAAEIRFLYEQRSTDPTFASNLCLLDLPNLLSALEHSAKTEDPERVVDLASSLESLVSRLNRPNALARAVAIRTTAAQQLGAWSHAQFEAEQAAMERLWEKGEFAAAVRVARSLLQKTENAGNAAYPEAAYDYASAHFMLGRSLTDGGAAAEALGHLDQAHSCFVALEQTRMAYGALSDKAACLRLLGRNDEAAAAYEEVIAAAGEHGDPRSAAANKEGLARVRGRQRRYSEALQLYDEVLGIFQRLGEPSSVASVWHQIGIVHQQTGRAAESEHAYQEALKITVQSGDTVGESRTLNQLGILYADLDRPEDAARCYRQAADGRLRLQDFRGEGLARSNLAHLLVNLGRFDEARPELERAIECKKPFGHVTEPWKTFNILRDLERAVGNETAAQQARANALEAYLEYRRDGGAPQNRRGESMAKDPGAFLAGLQQQPDLSPDLKALIAPLEAILAGSRDTALAGDPNLDYDDAAELIFLIERLQSVSSAGA